MVDDDDAIRALVCETLADEGYRTRSASHGREALEVVAEAPPRLILLDMRMPIMNGWDFADAYRRLPPPHAPIVVLTAGRDAAAKAADIRADDYLGKPFELDDLVAKVEANLRPR